MSFELPPLPWSTDALAPHMSSETLEHHHGKHHQTYVDKLNSLVEGTEWEGRPLEEIVQGADGSIFDNGAQHWNHTFFWSCLSPEGGGRPAGAVAEAIRGTWGDFDAFRKEFAEQAETLFGSGWTWLVRDGSDLLIVNKANAGNPLRDGQRPLLACDVWEHAYYLDHRNERPKYLEAYWKLVSWSFVGEQWER